jgi:hypothetical protein
MFQQLLPLLPSQTGSAVMATLACGTLAGLALWLAGARYSRMVITLLGVTLGGMIGMAAPRTMNWSFNTGATALVGALVLGVLGFACYRKCVAVGLIGVLCLWAALATWVRYHEDIPITWPEQTQTTGEFVRAVWNQLPEPVRTPMPVAIGLAIVTGVGSTLLLPKITPILTFSIIGVTMLLGMTLWAIQTKAIQWPAVIPAQTNMQAAMLAVMVLVGAVVQWQCMPAKSKPAAPREG